MQKEKTTGTGDKVLGMFGEKPGPARCAYRAFVEKGIGQGKRSDLTGGGLVRSAGGRVASKELKKAKIFQKSDDRILGYGDFVERVLSSANEAMEIKYDLESRSFTLDKAVVKVAEVLSMKSDDVWAAGRYHHIVEARSPLCYWAVRELEIIMSSLARKLKISVPAVCKSAIRGEKRAKYRKYSLVG